MMKWLDTAPQGSMAEIIDGLETSNISWGLLLVSTACVVLSRIALELGVYSNTPRLTAGLFALHLPVFYASLFISISLLLSVATGVRSIDTLKVVLLLSPIIVLPPVIDLAIYGYGGRVISYIVKMGDPLVEFYRATFMWTDHRYISLGQRITVHLTAVLCACYAWRRTKRISLSVSTWLATLVVIFSFAILPLTSVALLETFSGHSLIEVSAIALLVNGNLTLGPEYTEAAIVLLLAPGLLLAFEYKSNAEVGRTVIQNARWLRILHYVLFGVIGIIVGVRSSAPSSLNYLAVVVFLQSIALAFLSAVWLNDIADIEADRFSDPERPLVKGSISKVHAYVLAGVLAILSLAGAWTLGSHVAFVFVLLHALAWLYSMPPFRLRRWFPLSVLLIGAISVLTTQAGFSLVAGESAGFLPARLAVGLMVGVSLLTAFKDKKDAIGDAKCGFITLMTICKPRLALVVTAMCAGLGAAVLGATLAGKAIGLPLGTLLGIAAGTMIVRRGRSETPVLAVYIAGLLTGIILLVLRS